MLPAQTIEIIQSTVPLLEEHGRTITDVFYQNLFEDHPFLKNIFNMANQGKGEQSRALSDAVLAYAKNIENVELLIPTVQRIANKHASLGIQQKHYDVVGEKLLGAIQSVLDVSSDHPAVKAWAEAYSVLADVFIGAEKKIYQDNNEQEGGWEGFRDFYIDCIVEETPEVKSISFKPVDMELTPNFKGGQYIGVRVRPQGSEYYQIRQYSLSQFGQMRISVKAEQNGLVSNYLHNCKAGDVLQLQAPTGVFTLADKAKKHIFIAGGVGVTPLMSMLEESLAQGVKGESVLFIQCSKDEDNQIYGSYLPELAGEQRFVYKNCYENSQQGDHQGYLNIDILRTWLAENKFDTENSQVYFCGPKSFMAVLNQFFLRIGFDQSDIHYEVFGPTTEL